MKWIRTLRNRRIQLHAAMQAQVKTPQTPSALVLATKLLRHRSQWSDRSHNSVRVLHSLSWLILKKRSRHAVLANSQSTRRRLLVENAFCLGNWWVDRPYRLHSARWRLNLLSQSPSIIQRRKKSSCLSRRKLLDWELKLRRKSRKELQIRTVSFCITRCATQEGTVMRKSLQKLRTSQRRSKRLNQRNQNWRQTLTASTRSTNKEPVFRAQFRVKWTWVNSANPQNSLRKRAREMKRQKLTNFKGGWRLAASRKISKKRNCWIKERRTMLSSAIKVRISRRRRVVYNNARKKRNRKCRRLGPSLSRF